MKLQYCYLGKIGYEDAQALQYRLLTLRQQNIIPDTLLLLEHYPVITLGKQAKRANIIASIDNLNRQGIQIHETNRGGDVTYHGPGQIVGYPILDLTNHGKDIRKFIRNVEDVFIQLLQHEYGICAMRDQQYTGVWVGTQKITAIGFAIKRWVSMHGFAFNVNTNLTHFQWIHPCGIMDKGVTSLQALVGKEVSWSTVNKQVVNYFCTTFRQAPQEILPEMLAELLGSSHNANP